MNLPVDQEIQIAFNGTVYEEKVRTHKTTKGRVDGLTGFFRKHHLDLFAGAEIDVSYDSEKEILHLYDQEEE